MNNNKCIWCGKEIDQDNMFFCTECDEKRKVSLDRKESEEDGEKNTGRDSSIC